MTAHAAGRPRTQTAVPPLRVLLAEDDPDFRRLVAAVLRRDGHQVTEFGTGVGLAEQLEANRRVWELDRMPAVVVSDVYMPGMTGLSVLSTYREYPWCPPFILMTAFGSDETHEDGRMLGAMAILDKPFALDELRALVSRAHR